MDDIKEKLYQSIEKNGTTHSLTIELSQKLDKYIITEQRRYYGSN